MIPIQEILSKEIQAFLKQHQNTDVHTLLLKYKTVSGLPISTLINQIEARKKAKRKLANWFAHDNVVFPSPLAVEQSSANLLAKAKFEDTSAKSAVDITGGLGVDAMALSRQVEQVTFCEIQADTYTCAKHNFPVLGAENIQCFNGDGIDYLKSSTKKLNLIYMDPSRRAADKSRVFRLEDCSPNIVEHWDLFLKKGEQVMVKLSPLIDIDYLLSTLNHIASIKVLAVKNDVKEIIVLAHKQATENIPITCINYNGDKLEQFSCANWKQRETVLEYQSPQSDKYIYIPNNTILKANLQDALAKAFELKKWHKYTHIYSSSSLDKTYLGRIFKVEAISSFNKKELRKLLPGKQANVILKNTQLKASELQKRMGWKDGGDLYVIGGQTVGDKNVAVLARLC